MSNWQPIETAPKDGTHILAWSRYDEPHIVGWSGAGAGRGRWLSYGCDGPAISSQSDFGTDYQESMPTHWQPLPEPPQ
jgi:hypothetical protein